MKTLITSFGPFGVFESNPSHELMCMLQEDKEFSKRYNVLYNVIEVSYEAVDTWVNAHNAVYDLIIHMGVASGASLLRLEKVARNAIEGEDVRGWKPSSTFIDAIGDDMPTNFPEEDLIKIVTRFPEVSILSEDAGSYLCNYLYYNSLKRQVFKSCVLFVHVADVKNNEQAVDLAMQKQIVENIVQEFSMRI